MDVNELPISKTRRKKDMHELQALGEALVDLTSSQLAELGLPERLGDAVEQAKRISGFEARRRQMQYIGRLMRDVDAATIAETIARLRADRQRGNRQHHEIERWRERLLAEDAALTELAALAPDADVQQLRTLIRNARNEQARNQPPKAARALFRLLREILGARESPVRPDADAARD
ncbi:MAG: DUF615 domain-containing protein [Betaproteobacteria bacterium]|nr:MAG: DUF615 domain-containing protein [Betaproteobacteria bacterium]